MKKWAIFAATLVILGAMSAIVYVRATPEPGFPLDDAWIHQTYARNLGFEHTMAFMVGQPSTGSTAPAWTAILALGYVFNVPTLVWAYLWGSVFGIATAVTAALLSYHYFTSFYCAVLVGLISLLEWHMAWAAVSGMEVSLFTFLTLLYLLLLKKNASPVAMGFLGGLAFLVRPEGFILIGIYGLKLFALFHGEKKKLLLWGSRFLFPLFIMIGPLIVFNMIYGGRPFPNTVYAKFLQYGYPWSFPKGLKFLADVMLYFLMGPLLLLMPFVGVTVYHFTQTRKYEISFPLIWIAGLIGLYSVALPVIYHLGRYLMPLIPLIVILGVEGWRITLSRFRNLRMFWMATMLAVMVMVIALWVNGTTTYALQVNLLAQTHMKIGDWIRNYTPPNAVIATHDIGILGYKSGRSIIDLAGLITPEVIPIMSDQQQLAKYIQGKHASYLVVFSGYYTQLIDTLHARLVYSPAPEQLKGLQLEPLEVYQLEN